MEHTIKTDDIMVEWATRIVRFYKVVKATKKTITVREVRQIGLYNSDVEMPRGYDFAVMPKQDEWAFMSEEITKKVKFYDGVPYVVPHLGGQSAKPWDGKPVFHY